jgi:hypothetical protein
MRSKYVLFIVSAALSFSAALQGQEARGTITGRVIDPSGAVVVGAEVRVTNLATGVSATSRTNDSGAYSIPYLPLGTYSLVAESSGFKRVERTSIEVRVNDVLDIPLQLEVGNVNETIQVTATTPLLESSTAGVGQVIDGRRLTELPIQGGNASELALLAPGVINTTNLRERKAGFGNADSQFTTNGNPLYSNEFTIDGVPNSYPAGTNPQVGFNPPRSAVSEFKVQTSAFDASLGHTPGSSINAVTKSGTNQLHGELHHWIQNSALDASEFFQNRAGLPKTVYQDNLYGASLGGPAYIPKVYNGQNRTFFFYAWEANQWGKPMTNIGTVPTTAEKNGDLSALLALGSTYQIYDPLTTVPAATRGRYSRTPLAGNIIPPSRIDSVAKKLMPYWPAPNTKGLATGQNNYTQATKDTMDYFVHLARVDHTFSERNRAYLRVNYDRYLESKENFYDNIAMGENVKRNNRGLALDDVYILSPSSVLNFRYGISSTDAPQARHSQGFDLSTLGFSPATVALVDRARAAFPSIYINGKSGTCKGTCTGTFSGLGQWDKGEGNYTGVTNTLASTMTTLRGKHNLKYGVDFRSYRAFSTPMGYDVAPGFLFMPTYTKGPMDNSAASPIGQDFASFLLGIPQGEMDRSASYATQELYTAFFVHDDWRITRKLTLNIGLRYEYEGPMSERYDRAVRNFDFTSVNPISAQAAANYAKSPIAEIPASRFQALGGLTFAGPKAHGLWGTSRRDLLPRVGIAYQLTSKTVLRTGYGIFYDTVGVNRTQPVQSGFTAITNITPSYDNGQTYVATAPNPFPAGLLAPRGNADGLATYLGQDLTVYPATRYRPQSQQWTFGIQRLLPGGFLLDTNYAGNKAIHLGVARELNSSPYLTRATSRDQTFVDYMSQQIPNPFYGINSVFTQTISRSNLTKPFPEFGSIQETDPIGFSWYHALQVRVERRMSRGFTLNAAYTFSKSMEATDFLNSTDPFLYHSIAKYDHPQRLVLSGIWELPFGHGRAFGAGMSKALDKVVGGWQVTALTTNQVGAPLAFGDVIYHGDIHNIPLPKDQRSVDQWFNTAGFEKRPSQQLEYAYRSFPKYLAGVRADGHLMWNFSLIKNFSLVERLGLQFRAECYNCTNHPNFETPDMTVTAATFGMVSQTGGSSRQFQAALKLTF